MEKIHSINEKDVFEWTGVWSLQDVTSNKNIIFIFSDNLEHNGKSGAALARLCRNSFGLITKRRKGTSKDCYFTDADIEIFKENILADISYIENILLHTGNVQGIIFTKDAFPDIKKIEENSPMCYRMLSDSLYDTFKFKITYE
jgi:hypothetical protein